MYAEVREQRSLEAWFSALLYIPLHVNTIYTVEDPARSEEDAAEG